MARLLEVTVHSNKKCGLIERILDADSNQPPLASIREQELSKKRHYKEAHDPYHMASDMCCLALELLVFRMLSC